MDDKIITIFGTSRAGAGDAIFTLAMETGRLLAQAGFTIANGGYGGTMLAAAKGAAEAGGEIIRLQEQVTKLQRACNEELERTRSAKNHSRQLNQIIEKLYIIYGNPKCGRTYLSERVFKR